MKLAHLVGAALAALAGPVAAATLYSNDFDGNEFVASGVGVTALGNGVLEAANPVGAWSGQYFANRSIGNPATASALTLTGLAPHTQVSVSFLLGFLESWDGLDGGGGYSPDTLDFYVDGVKTATFTAINSQGSQEDFGGGAIVGRFVQANSNTYWSDTIVDMSTAPALTFAHTGTTLTLALQAGGAGWQGLDDEAWGVDALQITYDAPAVPEPASWALTAAGAAFLAAAVRRRHAKAIG